jgi:epoxyqueuosine reductase
LTSSAIKSKALELGFDLCGVSAAERHPKLNRIAEWIRQGRAGDMAYLSKSLEERLDPKQVLQSARTVVSLGVVYNTDQPYSSTATEPGRVTVARYAWGDDYHDVLRERLRALVQWMADAAPAGFEAFSNVDNGPVQERVFAEQAGLGWIGKNTCLINPALGSWLFLAEVLTNAALDVDRPAVDQCGTCTRCLDACPTGAIVEPYALDATRCLSYLTIEQRVGVAHELRPAVRQQVYGCDICQDVCPWNRRAATSEDPAWWPRPSLALPRLRDLCALSDGEWSGLLKGSAMRRAGLTRLRRSLAYAAAQLPSADARLALDALAAHPSAARPDVADAIEWARRQTGAA